MSVTIYEGFEYKELEIPISKVMTESGELDIFPHVQEKKYFGIKFRKGKLVLTAGAFVGQIPLNDQVIINVKPRVSFGSLISIVGSSLTNINLLDFYNRDYLREQQRPSNIFVFLLKSLSLEMQWILKEGLYRQYNEYSEATSMPKGRPQFAECISKRWSKGEYHRLDVRYFQLTADTPFNRLIKYTLWYALRHLNAISSDEGDLIRNLSNYYQMMESVSLDSGQRFLLEVERAIYQQEFPYLRKYYLRIMNLCLSIINNTGINLQIYGDDYQAASYILDMADVFEKYVFNLSKKAAAIANPQLLVLDGNLEGKKSLFEDSDRFDAKPDVIFVDGSRNVLIMDAKYKNKTSEDDRYQLITHTLSYGANTAIHVLPGSASANGLEYVGRIGSSHHIDVYKFLIDMESDDIVSAENDFVSCISSKLQELC